MKTENIRLEEFRQLRKHVRGSNKHLLVGIDIAKEKHYAFFGSATCKTLFKRLIFENSREGFEMLLARTEAVKLNNNLQEVVFGVEPTANYHKPLGEYLISHGHDVVLVAGQSVKHNRVLLDNRWDKNDTKDAANVADLVAQAKSQYYDHPCMEIRSLRSLLSLKRKLKKQYQGLKLRIRNNLLAQYFPEMDQHYGNYDEENLGVIKNYLLPSVISKLDYNEFFKTVIPRKKGLRQHKHLYRIWQLASESICCEAGDAASFEAGVLVEQLEHTRKSLEQVEEKIQKGCITFPEYKFLMSIPGFGPDVSSKVLAYVGDQYRFDNARQVLKMAGLDLCASRSGKNSYKAVPVISKRGKSNLRYALYHSATVAASRNSDFMKYFTEKIRGREKEKGIKTKMRVKLSAKMLIIAWTLMKKKEPFNPEHIKTD
jgi:transposase